MTSGQKTLLCIATYEKGQAFLKEAAAQGCRIILVTAHKLREADWPWEAITEIHTVSDQPAPEEVLHKVQHLARHQRIDRIIPLDEFDLEAAALIREEFRLPGMGQTTTRHFRDKLAMRVRAQAAGLPVPEFVGVIHYDDLRAFISSVPAPWVLKPRTSASAIGIRKLEHAPELWLALDELGESQSNFLLERFVPGDVFHVDSVHWERQTLAQAVHGYGATPMSLMQSGGVFTTRTLPRHSALSESLEVLDEQVARALGMVSGVTHSEFIRSAEDGSLLFLETAARVGGAFIAELVQYSSGINPWVEWARIECAMAKGNAYHLPHTFKAYAGSVICLAKQEKPDLRSYNDPEVVFELHKHHHAGLIVQSDSAERVGALVDNYRARFLQDFCASMPPPDRPTS